MSVLVEGERVLKVVAEGRIVKICVFAGEADDIHLLNPDDPESPVVLVFKEQGGHHYLVVYDHRTASREAMRRSREDFINQFDNVPCLCGFRVKGGLYLVLADIGTSDMADGGENYELTRTGKNGFDHATHRVVNAANHLGTGICLVEPRA